MRAAASASIAVAAIASASAMIACTLFVDSGGLSGDETTDSASPDSGSDGGAGNGEGGSGDGGGDGGGVDAADAGTPLFDQGTTWPVFTSAATASPTTPALTTSAACTDLIVLANSGISAGSTATATIATSTGMTFSLVTKEAGNNADTIYIWMASNACASRTGTVTVQWSLTGGSVLWSNVAVFGFTHSKGTGAVGGDHNPGDTSISTISINPTASGSWVFASLSGNNSTNADAIGTSGNFVQQWSGEGATQSFGPMRTPAGTKAGTPVTFSLTSPDSMWASAAVEVLSL